MPPPDSTSQNVKEWVQFIFIVCACVRAPGPAVGGGDGDEQQEQGDSDTPQQPDGHHRLQGAGGAESDASAGSFPAQPTR